MKTLRSLAAAVALGVAALPLAGCDKFLKQDPTGTVSSDQLNTAANLEGMVVAAYANLGNDHFSVPYTSMWPYGDVRSGDSYKGGGGTGDINEFNSLEQFVFVQPTIGQFDAMWYRLYVGVGRANDALRRINAASAADFPNKLQRQAELRFIRAHFYFMLKELFNRVPYIDENLDLAKYPTVSNVALGSDSVWSLIASDFRFAAATLPATQADEGRVTKYAAEAYLAKVQLWRAYVQNDAHAVTSVDQGRLQEVVQLTGDVIASGQYALTPDFADNFLFATEKNKEAIFKINMSQSDGTPHGRVDMANGLNYTMAPQYGCCWFHIPSQNLINAFKTDAQGLPMFATYNQTSLADSVDYQTNTVDPRLDHTVGIVGHPFKYEPGFVFLPGWARVPQVYGLHSSMKELQQPDCACLVKVGPFFASSKDIETIRYADVLLWQAEALIELGRQNEALPLINQVRNRAAASTGRLKYADGTPISNYNVQPYSGAGWTQDYARQALRYERRMEFAMEGIRFFDLVRWGVAAQTLNDYFAVEAQRHDYLKQAHFTAGRDEYLPIPQNQINFTQGLYQQNPGY
ncbi:glycan metabolism protein RagB [Gemmatimonadetes bacterium T265]|nr:glycan metabolism protein RagB [Gemmatimonadetes bacterium T265]